MSAAYTVARELPDDLRDAMHQLDGWDGEETDPALLEALERRGLTVRVAFGRWMFTAQGSRVLDAIARDQAEDGPR